MSLRHSVAVFLLMIMAMAMVWSKAVLGITMGFLAIVTVMDIHLRPFSIRWMLTPSAVRNSIREKPFIWVFALFALVYLVSIVYSGDTGAWWKLTHMKMAFILMPMSFAFLGPFNRKEVMLILLCMVIPAVWSTIWVQIAYYSEFELFSQSIGQGRSIPTPINHIRYSVVIAISMIVCMGFFLENWKLRYRWERIAYGITAAYLFYFLHILSVRSGLALGYLGILTLLAFYVSRLKGWQKVVLAACIILAPVAAYKLMPGFQLKVNYTLYDLGKFQAGEGKDYSDSERWQSWHAGLAVGNRHPFFGTSPGRFEEEMKLYYYGELQEDHWTRPHNQWINVFAMLGLLGLIVFTFTLIYPMKFSIFWQLPFMAAIYIMQLLAMMVEHPLDTQFGTSLFLMMTLLGLSYKEAFYKKHNSPDDI